MVLFVSAATPASAAARTPTLRLTLRCDAEAEAVAASTPATILAPPAQLVWRQWTAVKDCVATPLTTRLCARTGREAPASLLRLPCELVAACLAGLPGVALAAAAATCKVRCPAERQRV